MHKNHFYSNEELYNFLNTKKLQNCHISHWDVKHWYFTEKVKVSCLVKDDKVVTLNIKPVSGKLICNIKPLQTDWALKKSPSQHNGNHIVESWTINQKLIGTGDSSETYSLHIKLKRNLVWSSNWCVVNMKSELKRISSEFDFHLNYSFIHEEIISKLYYKIYK